MAITNFLPTVWSETLYTQLDKQYIGAKHCNRDFEGDIKQVGSTVKICGVGAVNVFDYTKNQNMSDPQTLSDSVRTLNIDQAKGFNFQIDDIDLAQSTPKLMSEAMRVAASALANTADQYIYSLYESAGLEILDREVTKNNILDTLIEARTMLFAQNVTDPKDIVFEVSPEVAALILRAKIDTVYDNREYMENGFVGSVGGCPIYVSNNIAKVTQADNNEHHKCYVRTRRAIAFAEQLSEIDAYRPEKRFADAVKGLHLYGVKVVYPKEFLNMDLILGE